MDNLTTVMTIAGLILTLGSVVFTIYRYRAAKRYAQLLAIIKAGALSSEGRSYEEQRNQLEILRSILLNDNIYIKDKTKMLEELVNESIISAPNSDLKKQKPHGLNRSGRHER